MTEEDSEMIKLRRKAIYPEKLEVLYDRPFTAESLESDFDIKDGNWYVDENGWLVGSNPKSTAAMVMTKADYFGDVLVEVDAETVLPATRDINVTIHGSWNEEKNTRDRGYVYGLEGWWEGFVGFEQSPEYDLVVNSKLLDFKPGKTYHLEIGNIGSDTFFAVDGVVALNVTCPRPIDTEKYGKVGFEAFCTKVRYKNFKVKRLVAEDKWTPYEPEFEE